MKPKDVDEYIAGAPRKVQVKLKELRATIKATAPDVEERLSYGMPYYGYKGRLAYFAYTKNHIGFYAMSPVLDDHKNKLKKYQTAKATVRFPLDEELPISLIKKLVKASVKRNDEAKKKK